MMKYLWLIEDALRITSMQQNSTYLVITAKLD